MSNYEGYLIKFSGTVMPNHYFLEYSSTPNRISDEDAGTDQNGRLWRSPLPHKRSGIKFSTHEMSLDDKLAFQAIINNSIINWAERKAWVCYWNDESNSYAEDWFYIPDIEYKVRDADSETIWYYPISIELIEY